MTVDVTLSNAVASLRIYSKPDAASRALIMSLR